MGSPTDASSGLRQLLHSQDPVLRRRLGYGAFVGVRYPYLYLETPKAACTTAKVHLWNLEGLGPLPYPSYVHARHLGDSRLSLLGAGEARAVEALCGPSVFRFCVWRDPVRRLASTFKAKIQLKRDPRPEWTEYRGIIANAFGLESENQIAFDHFAHFACALSDEQREPHFMSQWQLTLFQYVRYDRIVRMDRYAEDMAEVYRAIGVPASEWPEFESLRENFTGSETVEISDATAAMIRNAYAKDYEMLGRDPAAPYRGISY